MGSFGERMRREREMRGITLEEISESTKISCRSLRALEEEDFDKLPGGIFNKGFVRAYAHHVGIDEEQAVADFVAAAGEDEQPLPDPLEPPRSAGLREVTDAHPHWVGFVLLLAVFAGLVIGLWKLAPPAVHALAQLWAGRSQAKAAPPSPPINAPALPADAGTGPVGPMLGPAPEARVPARAPVVPEKKPVAKAKPVAVSASATEMAPGDRGAAGAASSPAKTPGEFVVEVRATKDAWVQIVVDGKLLSEGLLVPPAEKRVRAHGEVVVKTGNAGGVEVLFNGQRLAPLGDENQVATVTFNAAGMQR